MVFFYFYVLELFLVKWKFWKGRDRFVKFDLFVELFIGGRDFVYYVINFFRRVN